MAAKLTPAEAGYMGPAPGATFRCGDCVHFIRSGGCSLVAGPISPDYCCNLYDSDGGPANAYEWISGPESRRRADAILGAPKSKGISPGGLSGGRMADPPGDRLKCFEYGATVQAELHYADRQIESIERTAARSTQPPDILTVRGGEIEAQQAQMMRIQVQVFEEHLERAVDALENSAGCGLPGGIVQAVGDDYAKIKRQLGEGNFGFARQNLGGLRARLRHPERYFG